MKPILRIIVVAAVTASLRPAPAASAAAPEPPAQSTPRLVAPANSDRPTGVISGLGTVTAVTVNVKPGIDGQLSTVVFKESELVQTGQVLATVDPITDQTQVDFALVDKPQSPQSSSLVVAPITGLAGRLLVRPGNVIHSTDNIVTIAQVQPISVLFTIAEDALPAVRAQFIAGAHPIVEAWNRNDKVKLSSGVLTAISNEIDPDTGTVKLKASFDNKDRRLIPNRPVNVHLLLNSQ